MWEKFRQILIKFEVHADNRGHRRLQDFFAIGWHGTGSKFLLSLVTTTPNDPCRQAISRCWTKFHQVPNLLQLLLRYGRIQIAIVAARFTKQLI